MPVSDFECQIARGQIGRYLDGGVLSPQALAGLEEHLAECPGCKAAVAERRAALLGTLGKPSSDAPTRAVVSMPVENPLMAALRARAEESTQTSQAEPKPKIKATPRYAKPASAKAAPAKKEFAKPLALAALLAVVLLGMGRLSHVATAPSAKASTAFAADALPTSKLEARASVPSRASKLASAAVEARKDKGFAAKAPAKPLSTALGTKPGPAAKKGGSLGDLFESTPKPRNANPDARESATVPKKSSSKPARASIVTPRRSVVVRTIVRPVRIRPVASRPHPIPRRARPLARRATRVLRRAKPVPRATVRVYGLDGRPLKP